MQIEYIKKIIFKFYKIINILTSWKSGNVNVQNNGSLLINCRIISKNGEHNRLIFEPGSIFKNCKFEFRGGITQFSLVGIAVLIVPHFISKIQIIK